jgi:hypothetical protein
VTVYISIGNSDDKLTQQEWSLFVQAVANMAAAYTVKIHGFWLSHSDAPWQNAAWCVEFNNEADVNEAKNSLRISRDRFRQDSIAWAVAETEFI